jgi:hypothetical protein
MSDERFARLESKVDQLDTKVDRQGIDLSRQMRVLHEDLISRIAAIPDPTPAITRMFKAEMAELREAIGRRLDPLEATVREHSATLARLTGASER